LSEFNADPFSIEKTVTFEEVYRRWSKEKFEGEKTSNAKRYESSFGLCVAIHKLKFADIREVHLQGAVDSSGKNYPTLRKLKSLLNQLYRYALENDICQKDYAKFVDVAKHKDNSKEEIHKPFATEEITTLWGNAYKSEYIQIFLMLIYSGVRISEMLDLKKCNVHIDERYFDIVSSKTEAGIRKVPIAAKTLPFFMTWMERGKSEYLVHKPCGGHMRYEYYRDIHWNALMAELGMTHLPHDTRHTTVSLLARANVNQTIIKRIVGHSGAVSLTERVYTHFEIKQLIDAIDLI
jgi:integrase